MALNLGLFGVFLMIRQTRVFWVLGKITIEVKCLSHHLVSVMTFTGDANLDHLVKVRSARFLHCEVTIVPFPYSIFWNPASTPKREFKPHLLEGRVFTCYLKFFVRKICTFFRVYLCIQLFISVWTQEYLFYISL